MKYMIRRIESGIAGRGLNFRNLYSFKNSAIKLRINGTVSFKDDGSVKVIAEGEEVNLIKFVKSLEKELFFSSTENFYVLWRESTRAFKDFSIIGHK